jgi:hypothetical protein
MPTLKNWYIVALLPSEYAAPEQATLHAMGEVYNSDVFADGQEITTSEVTEFDLPHRIVHTVNTTYVLEGPPAEEWLRILEEAGDLEKLEEMLKPPPNELN